jgi:tetratricopeptide (TPR) repeat protein
MSSKDQDDTQANPLISGETGPDDETRRTPVETSQDSASSSESESTSQEAGETSAMNSGSDSKDQMASGMNVAPEAGEPQDPPGVRTLGTGAWRVILIVGLLALLLIAAASAFGGYLSGIDQRKQYESTQVAANVVEQFQLGTEDIAAGRYELARQRFEYVINLDPDYPGVTEQLAAVLLELNTTATPTAAATPTLMPTPDLRGAEELFAQAQVMLADERWTEAIDTLLKLRKDEPNFNTIDVDSMFYVALRNRGVQRILVDGDLEGGTYDLALAERFGPLDIEASNHRDWADLYVTGASFWGLDWGQAAFYFGQIVNVAPNLRDGTNMTATERFLTASTKYGDVLAENKEWCEAQAAYEAAYNISLDPALEQVINVAADKCRSGEKEDKEEEPPAETPAATEPPQETPVPTSTEPYPAPTQ